MARAAEDLHVAPSSVSMQIHELESRYGMALLTRGTRSTTPTAAGLALYERVRSLLAGLDAAADDMAAIKSGERGVLQFATSRTICSAVVRPALQAYECAYPLVDVSYHVMASSDQARLEVLSAQAEFALVGRVVPGGSLAARPFLREQLTLVVSPQHPLAGQAQLTLADLGSQTLMLREPPVLCHADIMAMLQAAGLTPKVEEFGSTEALKAAAAAGHGIAVLPRTAVADEIARGELRTCTVEGFRPHRTVHVLSLPNTPLSPVAASFLKLARARLSAA